MKQHRKTTLGRVLGDGMMRLFLILMAVAALLPFLYMATISLMEGSISMKITWDRLANATWSLKNYQSVMTGGFLRFILNSAIVSVYACFVVCLVSAMAAYAFSKKKFLGRDKLYYVYVMTMMIPGEALLIPTFLIVKKLGLIGSYSSLALPIFSAFGVILVRSFLQKLPNDLLEAADIDGCGEIRKFTTIVLPLIKPVMISLAIFTFISTWGRLLWPLVVATNDLTTVTQAVANMKNTLNIPNYGTMMAATTLAFLPPFILYLVLQKQFVEGIALSGIKG